VLFHITKALQICVLHVQMIVSNVRQTFFAIPAKLASSSMELLQTYAVHVLQLSTIAKLVLIRRIVKLV